MDKKIKKYRLKRINRRCKYCKYLEHHSLNLMSHISFWETCEAKNKIIHLSEKYPRLFCSCYKLKE